MASKQRIRVAPSMPDNRGDPHKGGVENPITGLESGGELGWREKEEECEWRESVTMKDDLTEIERILVMGQDKRREIR